MFSFLLRVVGIVVLVFAGWVAVGGVVSFAKPPPLRGRMVDIGGRSLHLICEGPAGAGPTALLEAGAFGFSADFGAVQAALTKAGLRSCAYDRAGMGYSDPSPEPRDGLAIERDLEALLAASGETGPFVLVGHSMAGLRLRQFAAAQPDKVAGLVLLDAATPRMSADPRAGKFITAFASASRWAARGAALGLFKPLRHTRLGDKIGLPPAASKEKRWAFANGRHNRTAADEVAMWRQASAQAATTPAYRPEWPVVVITAGPVMDSGEWKKMQAGPTQASLHGKVVNLAKASHTTMLGRRNAHEVVEAVRFVITAAAG